MIQRTIKTVLTTLPAVGVLAAATVVLAQGGHQHGPPPAGNPPASSAKPAAPVVQMQELHDSGGVPRGWKFTLPAGGDAARGRKLFADLECYKCHLIQDAGFPPLGTDGKTGPELTGMGRHHPSEYFAESILDPNAVLLAGPGYIGPDGRSVMPGYADSISVTQLLDLVAFLKSQDGGGEASHGGAPKEQTIGPYRVRLRFEDGHGAHRDHQAHDQHAGHRAHHQAAADKTTARAGHLMVFVADAATGEPVPYLPVSASVNAKGVQPRTVKLAPMTGGRGFHYGADVTLPAGTQRIVLSIGATTMRVMGADRERFARPQTVAFDWAAASR